MQKIVLLVLLMLLVPLQSVWAGVSAYAHHGEGEAIHHAANHQHQHKHTPDSDTSSGKLHHHHCNFSHSVGAAMGAEFEVDASPSAAQPASPYREAVHRSPLPDRPERPNWFSAVV